MIEAGMKEVRVYVNGPGAGRESAIRAIQAAGDNDSQRPAAILALGDAISNNVKASGSLTRGGAYTVERAMPASSHCLVNGKDLWGATHSFRSAKG